MRLGTWGFGADCDGDGGVVGDVVDEDEAPEGGREGDALMQPQRHLEPGEVGEVGEVGGATCEEAAGREGRWHVDGLPRGRVEVPQRREREEVEAVLLARDEEPQRRELRERRERVLRQRPADAVEVQADKAPSPPR